MLRRFCTILLFLSFFFLFAYREAAFCASTFQPGFRTLGVWNEDPKLRLDLNIWYPTTRQPRELNYPPWTITGALNARPAEDKFPLLVISHATPAERFSYHDLAAWLAENGFIVVAPTHSNDNMNNMADLFTWAQLDKRANEIGIAINSVLEDKDLSVIADADRIGLIGFGSGATSALLLGGAMPDCSQWYGYCHKAGPSDVYCSPWAMERMNNLCKNFPLSKSIADPRIKAVVAVAPGYGMIFDKKSFDYFYPALLLISAGKDNFNKPNLHSEAIAKLLGSKARYFDLPNADAGALMAICPQSLAWELPELCNSVSPEQKRFYRLQLEDTLKAFFTYYLLNKANIPQILPPPDIAKEDEPIIEAPKNLKQKRKGHR